MITYLLITAVRKISRHSKVMYSILLVKKKYKHLKIEGEKWWILKKNCRDAFDENSKSIFEFFKHSLDQKHAREALNK